MPGTVTSATWTTKSATPTGVDDLGTQTFASSTAPVSGVFYPDRRSAPQQTGTPGFLVEFDAVLISETFLTGKEGDTAVIEGNTFLCVGVEVFTLPFAARPSHAEYTLRVVNRKAVVA